MNTLWYREPAVWVCVVAVFCSLIDRYVLQTLFLPPLPRNLPASPRLFVAITSYCDRSWGSMVQELINAAHAPRQIRFGVVEYIRNVDETLEPAIPNEWRDSVHVYSVSYKTATTLRRSQQLCIEQLYTDEPFALLLGTAVAGMKEWDRKLLQGASADSVVTAHITSDGVPTFPCLRENGNVHHRPIVAVDASMSTTPSLIVQSDAVFVSRDAIQVALSSTNVLTVTARLVAAEKTIVTPTQGLFFRIEKPVSVPRGRRAAWVETDNITYAERCGIREDKDRPNINARVGLTHNPDSPELISKYGSVLGARLVLQEEKHETSEN